MKGVVLFGFDVLHSFQEKSFSGGPQAHEHVNFLAIHPELDQLPFTLFACLAQLHVEWGAGQGPIGLPDRNHVDRSGGQGGVLAEKIGRPAQNVHRSGRTLEKIE